MSPLVSVIIPTYNYARFVREAVDSALAQTYRPIEIIVVDDGSKDNTREVMLAYAGNPLVHYIRQENKGLPGARNTGIRAAKGKYIALLDADDVWEPLKLEHQVGFYEQHPEAAIVATEAYEFRNDHHRDHGGTRSVASPEHTAVSMPGAGAPGSSALPAYTEYTLRDLMEFSAFRPSSVMMRRDLCEAVGLFDEQFRYVEDLDMWARMTTQGRVYRLNLPLLGARQHPAVQSMHIQPHIEYHHRVLDKLFATLPELRAHPEWRRLAEARLYVHLSWMRYCAGDRWAACRDLWHSITQWPSALRSADRTPQSWKRLKLLVRYALRAPQPA